MTGIINLDVVDQIIKLVGGEENVITVSHCLTRLRFVLNNPDIADIEGIKEIPAVKGCFNNAGQFQIIIGTDVDLYYKKLIEKLKITESSKEEAKISARKNMKFWERLISNLAEIFVPLLPALICGGLLLGLRNVIGEMPVYNDKTLTTILPWLQPLYGFLWLPCEAIFHFLPVAICWSTVKKMGGSPILGIVLGITLVSPQLMNAYDIGSQNPDVWDFGIFSIQKVGYQAQVIPSILAGLFLGWFEVRLRKYIPNYLTLVIVPVVTILVSVAVAHAILGPLGRLIGNSISDGVRYLMLGDFAPIGSMIFGFFYSPLVITGLHHTTLAIDMQLTQNVGGTPIWPIIALSNIAQASAVVGIILISNKQNEREITIPAAISAYLGVTEPAMYGVNLRYRFPMLCAMIGAALAGLICGYARVLSNGIGVGGIPGILSIQPAFWGIYFVAMVVAIVIPIVLTMAIYRYQQRKGILITSL
ncbi:PTS trehalose transporter subunit IIBC [Pectobacterium wasabiae]|uniref:PTS system trehalose(Maltose)-specific transporter subunits IIBC n=1 Tax=Pectobacterium wasabiae TaxID=55208 RepID=A0AAW3EI44_9GAMM|nr:PTS trehalose transporter subunit IIBC [Pectobacterium wasabiae]AOR63821.1 PTS trehalose transporter subunit IIBC [Pectobacterium wasabiae CFBP 3304]EJS94208.1 Trehalose(Maltose)-specific PTS system component IIBC [Pectobacterium wasabiae CFBP 3304]KFX08444.1 PTS system trehalose(maltose)-specific transporter subunits IIBC [Pectobacterium wasabiae]KGA28471.1 PTS system trehalose(maltose)-specific transporter subunits IIBC [Pectobacterium wasabiae]